MASWAEFEAAAPALAALASERWARHGLFMLGTLRGDGRPRISPCEYVIHEGRLWFGMMWQSKKALDLVRDPRVTIHSAVTNKDGHDGEFKLYGRVVDVTDPADRAAYGTILLAETGWQPSEPYHLFTVDIREAAFVIFGAEGAAEVAKRTAGSPAESARSYADEGGPGHTVLRWREAPSGPV